MAVLSLPKPYLAGRVWGYLLDYHKEMILDTYGELGTYGTREEVQKIIEDSWKECLRRTAQPIRSRHERS